MSDSDTSDSEQPETVEVSKDELFEIEKLLSHSIRRLDGDAKFNDDRENRMRSKKGKKELQEAQSRLKDLRYQDTDS